MEMRKIEIKTRIMSQPNGSSYLTLYVKNGWRQRYHFNVKDSKELRDYLKSNEFKEYANSVFGKYEGMTYNEMCKLWDTDHWDDNDRMKEKLDRFAWIANEDQFKIKVSLKLTRTYSNAFTYRVEYSNNKDNRRCWFKRVYSVSYIGVLGANRILDDLACYLNQNKEFNDMLATYKTWDEFYNAIDEDGFVDIMDSCLMKAKLAA